MPFVTSLEQILEARIAARLEARFGPAMREKARQEGRQEGELIGLLKGLEAALEIKFDKAGKAFAEELKAVGDISKLENIRQAVRGAGSIDDLRKLL